VLAHCWRSADAAKTRDIFERRTAASTRLTSVGLMADFEARNMLPFARHISSGRQ